MSDPSVVIDAEPDWGISPEISYGFDTATSMGPHFREQRRWMHDSPVRSVRCSFAEQDERFQLLRNRLISGGSALCCVPIYSEPIWLASAAQGTSSITAETDLDHFWNIQNCSYGVLLNFASGQSEMVSISSVSGQVISLSRPIVNSWALAQTILYPAIAALFGGSFRGRITKRNLHVVEVEFIEHLAAYGDADPDWVGITQPGCLTGSVGLNRAYVPFPQAFYNTAPHNLSLYYDLAAHRATSVTIPFASLSGWPLAYPNLSSMRLCSHPFLPQWRGTRDYLICSPRDHLFWQLSGFTTSVRQKFTVPSVSSSGLYDSHVGSYGIDPVSGKFYVSMYGDLLSDRRFIGRRDMIYTEPGGTVLYDQFRGPSLTAGQPLGSMNLLFSAGDLWEVFYSYGYYYSITPGLRKCNKDTWETVDDLRALYINLENSDGSVVTTGDFYYGLASCDSTRYLYWRPPWTSLYAIDMKKLELSTVGYRHFRSHSGDWLFVRSANADGYDFPYQWSNHSIQEFLAVQ